ncbi:hypothetical protein [Kineosporia babensis]|uniref:Uncharacterized protein n=1 Tax=Kineosporia babensis TaxID=499548 RepID=A0A9X1N9E1_9ACTN|nr:hypothetical protein [Kineosporia babensis]MCD5310967.1 hypothetical protein [Kineosporia babensis]
MVIDSYVESLLRETLAAMVARNLEWSAEALQALLDQGDQVYAEAVELCFAVNSQVLHDLHNGPPHPVSIASLAESVVAMEAWAALDQPTVQTFMMALAEARDPAIELPAEAARTGFVVGAWLLAISAPENTSWEAVLDSTLHTLAAVPEGHGGQPVLTQESWLL